MSDSGELILLIEDEMQMRRFLRVALESEHYRLVETDTGKEGLVKAAAWNPDAVLLDLGLPDMDGIEVIKRLREWSKVPIIIISAREQENDKIKALDCGADDYLTKPFGVGELLARIRVASRHKRLQQSGQNEIEFVADELRIDYSRRQVFLDNNEIHLTPIEYSLIALLTQHAGKVMTHRQLLKEVWGPSHIEQTQYLRVYMTQLRHKIEKDPARPRFLINEPGVGYRFKYDPGKG
ncbi:MAG: DNA-binding response regulator [Deltaproteobacteria bacterium HGW-Deltaproteobacteria-12]|jgi:two-component system KDP operon response regulator KdpE|nr:MAG: DNA-binding response regulator [Deltaproteobacteria bacterium HGW-Deltaproteobacteria-12]